MTRRELKQLIRETMQEANTVPNKFYMLQYLRGNPGSMADWELWTYKNTLQDALKEKTQWVANRSDAGRTEKDIRVIECKVVG